MERKIRFATQSGGQPTGDEWLARAITDEPTDDMATVARRLRDKAPAAFREKKGSRDVPKTFQFSVANSNFS